MQNLATIAAQTRAKELRTSPTDAERRLWSRLRREQLGFKFRRQHPVGPYILDFACLAPRLAIEVDGSQHLNQITYDMRRSEWLASHGFSVLRFWANDVLAETEAVVQRMAQTLSGAPAPTPTLPQRGRDSRQGTRP